MHCEMPFGEEVSHGLQLWVNLAKKDKMTAPTYQELLSKDIPTVEKDGVKVRVIAGESMGVKVCSLRLLVINFIIKCENSRNAGRIW